MSRWQLPHSWRLFYLWPFSLLPFLFVHHVVSWLALSLSVTIVPALSASPLPHTGAETTPTKPWTECSETVSWDALFPPGRSFPQWWEASTALCLLFDVLGWEMKLHHHALLVWSGVLETEVSSGAMDVHQRTNVLPIFPSSFSLPLVPPLLLLPPLLFSFLPCWLGFQKI